MILGALLIAARPASGGKPAPGVPPKADHGLEGALSELSSERRTVRDPQSWITDASIFIRNALTTAHGLDAEQTLQVQTPKVLGDQARYLAASAGRAARDLGSLLRLARTKKPGAVPAIEAAIQSLQAARADAQSIVANAASGILAPGNTAVIHTALGKLELATSRMNAIILAYHLPDFVVRQPPPPTHQQAGAEAPGPATPASEATPSTPPMRSLPTGPSRRSQSGTRSQEAYADIQITLVIRRAQGTVEFGVDKVSVKSGQIVALTLINADSRESHNWVLVRPGRTDAVLARGMAAGVNSGDEQYAPDVLAKTGLVAPGMHYTVFFIAPRRPGLYPFISTAESDTVHASGFLRVESIG